LQARWGVVATTLPPDHPAWALEARYIALGIANLTFTLSPKRILLGGGVMQQSHLFDLIRMEFTQLLNGYLRSPELTHHLSRFIQPPQLGGLAGVLGSLVVAEQALNAPAQKQTANAGGVPA
jgi:fructokinase